MIHLKISAPSTTLHKMEYKTSNLCCSKTVVCVLTSKTTCGWTGLKSRQRKFVKKEVSRRILQNNKILWRKGRQIPQTDLQRAGPSEQNLQFLQDKYFFFKLNKLESRHSSFFLFVLFLLLSWIAFDWATRTGQVYAL